MALAGLVLAAWFFGWQQPASRLDLSVNRGEAFAAAEAVLQRHHLDPAAYPVREALLHVDNAYLAYLAAGRLAAPRADTLRRHLPPGRWRVLFLDATRKDRLEVILAPDGRLLGLLRTPPDDLEGARLPEEAARRLATTFLQDTLGVDLAPYALVDAQAIQRAGRNDYVFAWQRAGTPPSEPAERVMATVQGDRVGSYTRTVRLPLGFERRLERRQAPGRYFFVIQAIVVNAFWILALILFVLRFRDSEVSVRNALVYALTFLLLFAVVLFSTSPRVRMASFEGGDQSFLPFTLGIQAFFNAFALFGVWISGESVARETWPSRLRVFDGLFARRYFSRDLGESLLRGFALGLSMLGLWAALAWLLLQLPGEWALVGTIETDVLSARLPTALPAFWGASGALLVTAYTVVFTMSFLKLRLRRTLPAVLITLLLFDPIFADVTLFADRSLTGLLGLLTGPLAYVFALRYGFFTAFFGTFVFNTLPTTFMLLSQPDGFYQLSGGVVVLALGTLGGAAWVMVRRGERLDEQAIRPSYARYITERERLKMELDIARRAQIRMLPRTIPQAQGLDIAAFSEPAREVGGDYFDFFPLDGRCLGVAVGDVSGKGMPAALYMTMLKGFLQSRAEAALAPSDVLRHVNRAFFQTAEANTFVTLTYCLLDVPRQRLTFARAGHLPLLLYRAAEEASFVLAPPGLGIGLDAGPLFDRTLRDEAQSLLPGDLLLLCTDGLTEARNAAGEEFGLERVLGVLRAQQGAPAERVLQALRAQHEAFVGRVPVHDDLTCVVIRVV